MKRMIVLLWLSVALFSICTARVRADEITLTQTVQAGLMAQYPLEIHNDSSVDHHYQLAIDGLPRLLTATFVQSGPVLDSVTVPANSYEPVKLRVEVPAETPVGHYTAQFTATRDDGLSLVYPVTLNVENTYAVQIISQNVNVNTFSGQEFTFEATVANTGAAPVTNLSLKVGTPAKWVTQIEPAVVDQLAANANITYQVRVLVPASQITIDQPVPLTVTGDQVSSPESTIMVRVQKSPNYLIAAGAVMGLAVAGMLIYFRMKGRR
ncbi:MAG: hypothetical protein H6631_11325 [Anaerolineaceae bacterium]|nr:hypothetical protein [Anaerolineaceae bacterium]MCB9102257.1 hypothetical protein [Anaerolineales bacterium]